MPARPLGGSHYTPNDPLCDILKNIIKLLAGDFGESRPKDQKHFFLF